MSCIRYKFKSSLDYDTVMFNGLQLSVAELREKIMDSKKLGLGDCFTLEIMDAHTKKVYKDDKDMVSRNSSVIIMRVPKPVQQKLPKTKQRDPTLSQDDAPTSTTMSIDQLKKTGDLAGANATEEEKVMAMMSQAGEDYNPANYAKFRKGTGVSIAPGLTKPPPPNYICHRCNQKGHWIKFCPTNGDPAYDKQALKKPSGIPSSHVVAATANTPGVMRDRFGNLVVRAVDIAAELKTKMSNEVIDVKIPDELTCKICKELVRDAVIIPCCSESFCDECIRNYLLENDFICFSCKETDVSPDNLVSNKSLRITAKNFQSQLAERRSIAVARGLPRTLVQNHNDLSLAADNNTVTSSATVLAPNTTTNNTVASESSAAVSPPPPATTTTTTITKPIDSTSADTVPSAPISVSPRITPAQKSPSPRPEASSAVSGDRTPPSTVTDTVTSTLSNTVLPAATTKSSGTKPLPFPLPLPANPLPFPSSIRPVTTVALPLYPQPVLHNPAAIVLPGVPTIAVPSNPFALAANPIPPPVEPMARLTELLVASQKQATEPDGAPLSSEEFYKQQRLLRRFAGSKSRSPSVSSRSSYSSRSYYSSRSPSPYRSPRSRSRSVSPVKERVKSRKRSPHLSRHKHKHKRVPSPSSHEHSSSLEKRSKHKKRERDVEEYDKKAKQKRVSKQSKKSRKHKDSKKVKKRKLSVEGEAAEPNGEMSQEGQAEEKSSRKHKHHHHHHRHHKKKRRHSHRSEQKLEDGHEHNELESSQTRPNNGTNKGQPPLEGVALTVE